MPANIAHIASLLLSLPDTSKIPSIDTVLVMYNRQDWAKFGRFHDNLNLGSKNLMQGLQTEGNPYLKVYGLGGLATYSKRGADPVQTQVLWNGIPVANSALGIADLNLLAVFPGTQICSNDGPGSVFNGSGSIGGNLELNHKTVANNQTNLQLIGGSYKNLGMAISTALGIGKLQTLQLDVQHHAAENNYLYKYAVPNSMATARTENAATEKNQFAMHWQSKYKNLKFQAISEYGNYAQEIPKTLQMAASTAKQWNRNWRNLAEIKFQHSKIFAQLKAAYTNDFLRYNNPESGINDTTKCNNWYFLLDISKNFGKHWQVLFQSDWMRNSATVSAYLGTAKLIAPAQNLNLRFHKGKFTIQQAFRWEWREKIPVIGWALQYQLFKTWQIIANAGNTFRRPTLNDLYWGGTYRNQLKSEYGKYLEFGFVRMPKKVENILQLQGSVFYRNIADNIRWVPNGPIWEPMNVSQFIALGTQYKIAYLSKKTKNMQWKIWHKNEIGNYRVSGISPAPTTKPILIPAICTNQGFEISVNKFSLQTNYQITGSRFITADNSAIMPAYLVGNITAQFAALHTKKILLQINLTCNNFLNNNYQIMPDRPMPGRNYLLQCNIQLR